MFLPALAILIMSLPVTPFAKGTEQACKPTKENNMNKVFKVCLVPFIVIIYLILVQMSIPKNVKVYAMNLTRATTNNPKLMMVMAGIPAYHSQSTKASHNILNRSVMVSPGQT
jgi:hypothetical protein